MRRIQPNLSMANPDLTHEFTALSFTVVRVSVLNDGKSDELVRMIKKVELGQTKMDRLARGWLRMRDEIANMMQEWSVNANSFSAKGDDSAKNEEAAILDVYNKAVAGL